MPSPIVALTPAGDKFAGSPRRPSVFIPPLDGVHENDEQDNNKLRLTLEQGWKHAVAEFKKKTNRELGNYAGGKEGVLGTLRKRYAEDNKEAKKKDELLAILDKVLNGVELIGSVTAQAASMVFGPANLCFNALDMLISIPKQLKKVADDLCALFKEISNFLANFKIFQRIDRRSMLDIALVTSTNDILMALVDVCALSIKVLDSPLKTVFGDIFLGNSSVKDALDNFKELVNKQNKLTNTVTLETVLQNKELSKEVLRSNHHLEDTSRETIEIVRYLQADSVDNKNMKLIRETIVTIEKAIGVTETAAVTPLRDLEARKTQMLDDTLHCLNDEEKYQQWNDPKPRRKLLFLEGDSNTGKSHLLGAIAQKIDETRKQLRKEDHSIYLAYYAFSRTDDTGSGKDGGKFNTPMHTALKIMAAQVARQSTSYARTLSQSLDAVKGQKTLQEFWTALKLVDFPAPPNSVLYLFFDGLDRLKSDLRDLNDLLKATVTRKKAKDETRAKLRFIFTGDEDAGKKLEADIGIISTAQVNRSVLEKFVLFEMQNMNIFQEEDEESSKLKDQLLEIIPSRAKGSFAAALQKLRMVKDAIDEDADSDELLRRLDVEDGGSGLGEAGRAILDNVCARQKAPHREQLKELLIWSTFASRRPYFDELESALFLQHDKRSLEPLDRKMKTRFPECFMLMNNNEQIITDARVDAWVSSANFAQRSADGEKQSKISVNISIENADEVKVKQFLRDLNSAISDVRFEINSQVSQAEGEAQIAFPPIEAHFTILKRCFRALNDDKVREKTKPLVRFAARYLPYHIFLVEDMGIHNLTKDQKRILGQGLVNFLCDRDVLEEAWDIESFDPAEWMGDRLNVTSIETILRHPDIQAVLEPKERRWAVKHTSSDTDLIWFFESMAISVAYKWLGDLTRISHAIDCFDFIDKYLDLKESYHRPRRRRYVPSDSLRSYRSRSRYPYRSRIRSLSRSPPSWRGSIPVRRRRVYESRSRSRSASRPRSRPRSRRGSIPPLRSRSRTRSRSRSRSRSSSKSQHRLRSLSPPSQNRSSTTELRSPNSVTKKSPVLESVQNLTHDRISTLEPDSSSPKVNGKADVFSKESSPNTPLSPRSEKSAVIEDTPNRDVKAIDELSKEESKGKAASEKEADAANGEVLEAGDDHNVVDEKTDNVQEVKSSPEDDRGSDDGRHGEDKKSDDDQDKEDDKFSVRGHHSIPSPPPPPSRKDRVERAKTWALEKLGLTLNSFIRERVAYTLLGYDNAAAIEYFDGADESPKRALGLAQAFADDKKWQEAIDALKSGLDILRPRKANPDPRRSEDEEEEDTINLFNCLNRSAEYHTKLDQNTESLKFMEEALECCPEDNKHRALLLYELCKANEHARAQDIYQGWEESYETYKAKPPTHYFTQELRDSPAAMTIEGLIYSSRGSDLHSSIVNTLLKAIDEADEAQQVDDQGYLWFAHGLAVAIDRDDESMRKALDSWETCFILSSGMIPKDDAAFLDSSLFASMYYFDEARRKYLENTSISAEEKKLRLEDLRENIISLLLPIYTTWRVMETPKAFIAAYAWLTGQNEVGREILKAEVANAIEILGDEDPDNDHLGIFVLAKVLCRSGDQIGALCAWSLLDRKTIRKRLREKKTKAEAEAEAGADSAVTTSDATLDPAVNDEFALSAKVLNNHTNDVSVPSTDAADATENVVSGESTTSSNVRNTTVKDKATTSTNGEEVGQQPEAESATETKAEVNTSPPEEDPVVRTTSQESATKRKKERDRDDENSDAASVASDESELENWVTRACRSCEKEMESGDADQWQWWCKYCPDYVFCPDCMEKLKKNELQKYICNPAHEFWPMKHYDDYDEEDVKDMNVRIEWEWDTSVSDDPREWKRHGGRIVELKEWMDVLRKQWGIEEGTTEGRVQK